MTEILKLAYGIYPKTEKLRIRIGRWERGVLPADELESLLAEETGIYEKLARDSGIGAFTDPLFNWYDIFRPLSALSGGIEFGPLTRYGETNTFYRLPEIRGNLKLASDPTVFREIEENPPLPLYHVDQGADQAAFLPGPETFYHYCGNIRKLGFADFAGELGAFYGAVLSKFRFKKTVVFESVPLEHNDFSKFYSYVRPGNTILVTRGSLDGSALASAGAKFHSVVSVPTGKGLEVAAEFSEVPGLALMDAHNTRVEDPASLRKAVETYSANLGVDRVYLTHTNYLDFLPRKIAEKKIEVLGKVGE